MKSNEVSAAAVSVAGTGAGTNSVKPKRVEFASIVKEKLIDRSEEKDKETNFKSVVSLVSETTPLTEEQAQINSSNVILKKYIIMK